MSVAGKLASHSALVSCFAEFLVGRSLISAVVEGDGGIGHRGHGWTPGCVAGFCKPDEAPRDRTAWLWMQCGSNRSPRGKFPSIREKNWEFCKFEGVAITCPRTNTRHFRRFSAKFPVRTEPGILLSNREFFLSNREISSAKTGNRRPSYARPFPTRGKGRLALAAVPGRNGNADSRITD